MIVFMCYIHGQHPCAYCNILIHEHAITGSIHLPSSEYAPTNTTGYLKNSLKAPYQSLTEIIPRDMRSQTLNQGKLVQSTHLLFLATDTLATTSADRA
jgi:hypothetical protein